MLDVNISVQETNSTIFFIDFFYKSQFSHKENGQSSFFTSIILERFWEGCCFYSVTSLNSISPSFFLALVFGIRKARCPWGSTLTACPKDFPSFRNSPKHLSKINLFSVLSSNMSYFDIYYFIDISFFAFC